MLKKISFPTAILALGILIIVFVFFFYAKAWQEPSVAPPGGNVPAPLNTGGVDQTKDGKLIIYGGVTAPEYRDTSNSNYYLNPAGSSLFGGQVGISPTSPPANNNALEISQYDINVSSGVYKQGNTAGIGTSGYPISCGTSYVLSNIEVKGGIVTRGQCYPLPASYGVITNKGLQKDASNNFGIVNCSSGQIMKYNSSGQWVCDTDQTGAGGGAPLDASYVVLSLNGTLTAERVLTAGTGVSFTDGGANGNLTITNTGDLSNTNEIQNVISNKGLQRDASNNFGIINCTTNNQIMKYNTVTGQWVCANDEAGGISWPLLAPDGTAGAPSYSFSADTNTGLFRSAADTLAFSTGGISRLTISTTAVNSSLPLIVTTLTTSDGSLFLNDPAEEGDISRADQIYGLNDLRLGGDSDFTGEPDAYSDLYINPGGDVSIPNGKVGIGTNNPIDTFNVNNGNIRLSDGGVLTTSKFNTQGVALSGDEHSLIVNGLAADRPEIAFYRGNNQYPQFALRMSTNINEGGSIWAGTGTGVPLEVLTVRENGRVGINTTAPTEKLDVRGNIKMGSAGELFAAGGEENLRIVRGRVDLVGQPVNTESSGPGFKAKKLENGRFLITFNTPFTGNPTVVASIDGLNKTGATLYTTVLDFSQVEIKTRERYFITGHTSGAGCAEEHAASCYESGDFPFNFIAVGPR